MIRKGLALLFLILTTGFASNQALSRADIYANIGNGFSWTSTAPAWSGDHTIVTKADFTTQVHNNGNCAPGQPSSYVMVYSDMQACAISSSPHSPILANNTFSGGSMLNWGIDASTGCTNGTTFGGMNAADYDGDSGYTQGGSGLCYTSAATVGINQTFSIAAAPTNQSFSVQYLAPSISAGDALNCTQGFGSATNLVVKINGTVAGTLASPTLDGAWHQFSGNTTLLVSGSNTVDVSVQVTGAAGNSLKYNPSIGDYTCSQPSRTAQTFAFDAVALTATY